MKKKDFIVIIGLSIICVIGYFLFVAPRQSESNPQFDENGTIEINYKDQVIGKVDISINKTYTFEGDYGHFSLEVKDRQYRAVNVDCPNHDCEKIGWLKENSPLPIVCIPNQIFVIQTNVQY